MVAVKQLERYPVDLYYLVDVSASMQENLDHVGDAAPCSSASGRLTILQMTKQQTLLLQPS